MSGWKMEQDEMLERESIEKILSPHPLSFMGLQSLCIFLIVWGLLVAWLVNFSDYNGLFENRILILVLWSFGLLLVGVIASLITVLWRIFFIYCAIVISGVALTFWLNLWNDAGVFLPAFTVVISIIGFLLVEWLSLIHI